MPSLLEWAEYGNRLWLTSFALGCASNLSLTVRGTYRAQTPFLPSYVVTFRRRRPSP